MIRTYQEVSDAQWLWRLIEALERADFQIPRSQEHDDAMDDVWGLLDAYKTSHVSEKVEHPERPDRAVCTGDPCICENGIGCVTVPVEQW